MPARIVVFGATGYTGRETAKALVRRGARPVVAGRSREKVKALAAELGGLESAVADVADASSVRALVGAGDVLVTTVGPFNRWGEPAAEAAIDARAHYLDSTGEPGFIRRVFEEYGPRAEKAGIGMLTAFGYDYVPGNLAGALALRDAGPDATRVDVGYFVSGRPTTKVEGGPLARLAGGMGGMSGGTLASTLGAMADSGFGFRKGKVVTERTGKRVGRLQVGESLRQGISVGASEHYTLPRLAPNLREVNAYLGWFGSLSRVMQATSAFNAGIAVLPGGRRVLQAMAGRASGSTGGPSEEARAETRSQVVATAYDAEGNALASTALAGVNGYTFTFEILAWGAMAAAEGGLQGTGALGPADGFGVDRLREGVESAGLGVQ
jgi:short subunit dehydrogenase-like uncharacterized protein